MQLLLTPLPPPQVVRGLEMMISWTSVIETDTVEDDGSVSVSHALATPRVFTAIETFNDIASGHGFLKTTNVDVIQPGDVVAIRFALGTIQPAHTMLVVGYPTLELNIDAHGPFDRFQPSPEVYGTWQYSVPVLDMSKLVVLRLYCNRSGEIVGHSTMMVNDKIQWMFGTGHYVSQEARRLIIGSPIDVPATRSQEKASEETASRENAQKGF